MQHTMRSALWISCSVWLLSACGDAPSVATRIVAQAGDAGDDDDAGSESLDPRAACRGLDDGTPCGHEGQHCIDARCVYNTCGDGVRAEREGCDDGNALVGDGCDPACRVVPETCGDALVQAGEECDDGNVYDLDACSTACTRNACGNGRVDGLEECDDGNVDDLDTCSSECLEVRCRNGRLDPGEECDDGNRIHTDGCTNACKIVVCGNGHVEGDEECDDGNAVEADACANTCTRNVCGNRRVDPGEACDGDTVDYSCADDCSEQQTDRCRPCEAQESTCGNYEGSGYDLVAGCLDGLPDPELVSIPGAGFAAACIAVVSCARQNGCGFDPARGPIECYCGSNDIDACSLSGPAADAKCVEPWQVASGGTTNTEILDRISDLGFASGWAYYLLTCDAQYCADTCVN
jgi:cysteine-rich repeat protein